MQPRAASHRFNSPLVTNECYNTSVMSDNRSVVARARPEASQVSVTWNAAVPRFRSSVLFQESLAELVRKLAGQPLSAMLTSMGWEELITVTAGVRSGKPCVRGTRITVQDVLEYLAAGMTEAQIVADFPSLTSESIRAVLAFAAARERRLASPAA